MQSARDPLTTSFASVIEQAMRPLLDAHREAIRGDVRKALAELRAREHGPDQAAFDTRGAAAYLGISSRTVARLKASGELPHVTVGRQIRFRREDLDQYLARTP